MIARALLATPAAIVLGFYIVAIGVPTLFEHALPDSIRAPVTVLLKWSFWILAVVWAFALFTVARKANRMGSSVIGGSIFAITLVLLAVWIVVEPLLGPDFLSTAEGARIALYYAPLLCAVISIGLAASALDTSEGGSGWPFKWVTIGTWFAIFFLPIGIWFLSARVRKLLSQVD